MSANQQHQPPHPAELTLLDVRAELADARGYIAQLERQAEQRAMQSSAVEIQLLAELPRLAGLLCVYVARDRDRAVLERHLLALSVLRAFPCPDVCTGPRRDVWVVLDAAREMAEDWPRAFPPHVRPRIIESAIVECGLEAARELSLVRDLAAAASTERL